MYHHRRDFRCLPMAAGLLLALAGLARADAPSDPWYEQPGLLDMLPDGGPNAARWMRDFRISVGGWVNAGITYNPAMPGDRFNGTVTLGDRSGELQLDNAHVYLDRSVEIQGERWDFGCSIGGYRCGIFT